jgi:hypothetical protein
MTPSLMFLLTIDVLLPAGMLGSRVLAEHPTAHLTEQEYIIVS